MLLSDGNPGDADTEQDDKKVYTVFRMMSGTFQPDTTASSKQLAGALHRHEERATSAALAASLRSRARRRRHHGVAKSVLKGEPEDDGVGENLERIAESAESSGSRARRSSAVARKQLLEATERLLARAERR